MSLFIGSAPMSRPTCRVSPPFRFLHPHAVPYFDDRPPPPPRLPLAGTGPPSTAVVVARTPSSSTHHRAGPHSLPFSPFSHLSGLKKLLGASPPLLPCCSLLSTSESIATSPSSPYPIFAIPDTRNRRVFATFHGRVTATTVNGENHPATLLIGISLHASCAPPLSKL
jgi:hypothetical protein